MSPASPEPASAPIAAKNVVLCGGTAEDRRAFIARTKAAFLARWPSAKVFTLSEHIGDSDRYLKSARTEFPIKPRDKDKYALGHDQLNDSYLDWVKDHKSVLVVIPEAQKLHKNAPDYFYQVLGDYMAVQRALLGRSVVRFLATLAGSPAIDVRKVPVLIGGDWRPSEKDLEVVVLPG